MHKLLTILFFWIITFSSCLSLGDGSDTLVKETSNNLHSKKAILFLREAGATVANSYQVSITDYEDTFDTTQVGNTFTVDTNHGDTVLDSTSINFTWLSDHSLQIDYDKKLRTFIKQRTVDDVTIVYKAR